MKLSNKKSLFILFSVFSIIGYSFVVFAAAPNGGYTPGTTLDPDCAPGDTDCIVALTTGGSSQWDDVVGGINYAGGNVGIGTTTPSAALDVVGTIQGSNLNITGDGITTAAPTNISVSFIYDNSYNYSAYSYAHNYRVYSYKDTVQGRVYSPSYLTITSPSEPVPAAPTNLVANQTCTDGCNYYADGSVPQNFRVYSYKFINDQRIYSTSYATLVSNFIDDNSNSSYDVTLSWDPVVGADGYRILKYDQNYNNYNYDAGYDTTATSIVDDGCGNLCYDSGKSSATTTNDIFDDNSTNQYGIEVSWDPVVGADGYRVLIYDPNYNGYNYDAGYDTTATSFIDDACGSICFDSGLSNVGQTSVYTNVATINGQLTLTGPIIIQGSPIRLDQNRNFGVISDISTLIGTDNVFFGDGAGNGVTTITNSNFFGTSAGSGATSASNSNFFGQRAGINATNANNSNFFGYYTGINATNASDSNFFGQNAGSNAIDANRSNFFGSGAGSSATNANNSNFFGINAGAAAINAFYSNFFGESAGGGSTNANNSNFFGHAAGYQSTNAANSNFFGYYAGSNAINANNANFIGQQAGQNATNADRSNFIGQQAGQNATNARSSNFFGQGAGNNAVSAYRSNFLGVFAGQAASDAYNANFIGESAGQNATNANNSTFIGYQAGTGATGAYNSNFLGQNAGLNASNAYFSNFLGQNAGNGATGAYNSNILGAGAGLNATNASRANFFGQGAGQNATNANNSNFIGFSSGANAASASYSNFIGYQAGNLAASASYSNFIGHQAGNFATNASYSIIIGYGAGNEISSGIHMGANNIVIGTNVSLPNAVSNSMNIGGILFGSGISSSLGPGPNVAAITTGKIGIATIPTTYTLEVGNGSVSGIVASFTNSTGSCTINPTASSVGCTSDERLKTNISNLNTDTLDKLLNIKTVTYNWVNGNDTDIHIGFLAQDLQQYFPEMVSMGPNGFYQVNYGGMAPILVESIREMNLKITDINDMETPNTWRDSLIAWFGNVGNGITELFAGRVRTHELCLDDLCVTKDQLQQLLQNNQQTIVTSSGGNPPTDPDPTITPDDTTVPSDNPDTVVDSNLPTDTNPDTTTGGDTPIE